MTTEKKPEKPLRNWAIFSGIGLQMGLTIFLGNALGAWLDKRNQTTFLEETITIIAVFISMFMVVYRVNRLNKK